VKEEMLWRAFCTVWWFASGERIMMLAKNRNLLRDMYCRFLYWGDER